MFSPPRMIDQREQAKSGQAPRPGGGDSCEGLNMTRPEARVFWLLRRERREPGIVAVWCSPTP